MANLELVEILIIGLSTATIIIGASGSILVAAKKFIKDWTDAWENGIITKDELIRQIDDSINLLNVVKHYFKRGK